MAKKHRFFESNCRNHFLERVEERYGLVFDKNDYMDIREKIRNGIATFLKRSGSCDLYKVVHQERKIFVAFDYHKNVPRTALLKEHCD